MIIGYFVKLPDTIKDIIRTPEVSDIVSDAVIMSEKAFRIFAKSIAKETMLINGKNYLSAVIRGWIIYRVMSYTDIEIEILNEKNQYKISYDYYLLNKLTVFDNFNILNSLIFKMASEYLKKRADDDGTLHFSVDFSKK